MKKNYLLLCFSLCAGLLFSACTCVPLIDKVSLKNPGTSTGDGPSIRSNNTYTPPVYSKGAGSAGSIICIYDTTSPLPVPIVQWYRNTALVGVLPSTAINLQLVKHEVRFYNTKDKKWFPDKPIAVELTKDKKVATIKVKCAP